MDVGGRRLETCGALCSEKDRPPAESTPAATVGTDAAHGRVSTAGAVNGVCPARAPYGAVSRGERCLSGFPVMLSLPR